jgi:hypothetical protein
MLNNIFIVFLNDNRLFSKVTSRAAVNYCGFQDFLFNQRKRQVGVIELKCLATTQLKALSHKFSFLFFALRLEALSQLLHARLCEAA